jgi:Domain of unknown function (DUF5655)/Domain of unknown function (DUF4287)
MSAIDRAYQTQLDNIQKRTGKTLDELFEIIRKSGLPKHGEIVAMLKRDLGMGHGDANTVAKFYFKPGGGKEVTAGDAIDGIYSGPKAALRPIHDELIKAIAEMGPCEIAPKKGYVSVRRKRQFAMIGPATRTRVEVGLNMKGVRSTARLAEMPPGGICQYKVNVTDVKEVDWELIGWIRLAYDSAG